MISQYEQKFETLFNLLKWPFVLKSIYLVFLFEYKLLDSSRIL